MIAAMFAVMAADLTIPEGYATVLIGALAAGFVTFMAWSMKWFVEQARINERTALLLDALEKRVGRIETGP